MTTDPLREAVERLCDLADEGGYNERHQSPRWHVATVDLRAALAATAPTDGPTCDCGSDDGCTCTITAETQTVADDCPVHHVEPYMAAVGDDGLTDGDGQNDACPGPPECEAPPAVHPEGCVVEPA